MLPAKPKVNRPQKIAATSVESDAISKDLKKRGMTFVGSTIIYAYMQAIGMLNDHMADCFLANAQPVRGKNNSPSQA